MSTFRLKQGVYPPGGFPFKDPRTGKYYEGLSNDLNSRAREIIRDRLLNPKIYPQHESQWFAMTSVIDEIILPICIAWPNYCITDGKYFSTGAENAAASTPQAKYVADVLCPQCGAGSWEKVMKTPTCKSCGPRLAGWRCSNCGYTKSN